MQIGAYIHCRPNGTPFYVGKGSSKRACNVSRPGNIYHQRIVNKYNPENILIGKLECSSEQIAFDLEKGLIKCLKTMGVKLTNMTDGGDGTRGYKFTEAQKRRLSKAHIGFKQPQESIEKRRKANTGKKRTSESRARIAAGNLGLKRSEETKAKLKVRHASRTEEEKRKRSENIKAGIAARTEAQKIEKSLKLSIARKGRPWSEARRKAQNRSIIL